MFYSHDYCLIFIFTDISEASCLAPHYYSGSLEIVCALLFTSWVGMEEVSSVLVLWLCMLCWRHSLCMRRPLAREKQNVKKRELKVRSKCVYRVLMEVVNLPINSSNFSSCTIETQFWSHLRKR